MRTQSFLYEFCDGLAVRLCKMHDLGNTATKAQVILAAARLGESHNRWYVMHQVLRMCDQSMDDNVARRVALEIEADAMHYSFSRCADGISRRNSDYHPIIARALEPHSRR